ncbi:SDR family oxidoreductase [Guptibacillus algicola]|uniref:SDR family oxidoreductase n=1 Tax=Guptibacillus algicola TaxID=225844 RepID=UPI001CD3C3F9|nr:SDR family oxidoreductase [Alkalihalobacillus algicola]MCA0988475.1 SDR family oxidoreductase [Alkalihalobacillus algicola]
MNKRIAIVTGASRPKGIGAAICRALAEKGVNIFFTHLASYDYSTGYDDANENWAEEFREELKTYDVEVACMVVDLKNKNAPKTILTEVERTLGKPTILVNNATHCVEVGYKEITAEILDDHYAVNVRGTTMLSVEFAKRFKGTSGRIINLVSGQDKSPEAGNIAYVSTKGAVSAFTRTLAVEVASQEITVNAIDPGPTDSGGMDKETQDFLRPKFPTGRIGKPEDAARLIAFLASDEARWITGQIIHSDGGFFD